MRLPPALGGVCLVVWMIAAGAAGPKTVDLATKTVDQLVNDLLRARGLPPLTGVDAAQAPERRPDSAAPAPPSGAPPLEQARPMPAAEKAPILARDPDQLLGEAQDSLGQILTELFTENPRVLQALAKAQAAGYEVAGARSGYFPYLMADSRVVSNEASATTLNLVQPLWSGGLTGAQVDEAQAERRLALVGLNETRLELGMLAAQAYFEALLAQTQAGLWAQYRQALEDLSGVIRRRAAGGLSPPVDVQTALARLRQADAGAAANQATLAASITRLETLLEHPVETLAWPPAGAALTSEQLDRIATGHLPANHPLVARSRQEVTLAQARAEISSARLWPQLSLQYSYLVQQQAGDFTPDNAIGLVLQFQTDQALRGYRSAQAQQSRAAAAAYGVAFSRRDVRNRVRSARVQRDQAALQFTAQAAAAAAYARLVDSYLRQFKAGRKSWVELLNAQREYHQALLATAAARQTYWAANAQLALQGMVWRQLSAQAPLPVTLEAGE